MSPRIHIPGNENLAVRSGPMQTEIPKHSYQRAEAFFAFLVRIRVLADYVTAGGIPLKPSDVMLPKASHQADQGYDDPTRPNLFNRADPKLAQVSTTGHSSMDAAHQCNIGISFAKNAAALQFIQADPFLNDTLMEATAIHSSTRLLPTSINVGPDKVVDKLQVKAADAVLASGVPVISPKAIAVYVEIVVDGLKGYKSRLKNAAGIADIVDLYIAGLEEGGFTDRLFASTSGSLTGLFAAHRNYDYDAYVRRTISATPTSGGAT